LVFLFSGIFLPLESLMLTLIGSPSAYINIDAKSSDSLDPPFPHFKVLMAMPLTEVPTMTRLPTFPLPPNVAYVGGVPLRLQVHVENLDQNNVAICTAATVDKLVFDGKANKYSSTKNRLCSIKKEGGILVHSPRQAPMRTNNKTITFTDTFSSLQLMSNKDYKFWTVWVENHNMVNNADIEFSISTRVDAIGFPLRTWLSFLRNSLPSVAVPTGLTTVLGTDFVRSWTKTFGHLQSSKICQQQKNWFYRGSTQPNSEIQTAITVLMVPIAGPAAASFVGEEIGKIPNLYTNGHTLLFVIVMLNITMWFFQKIQMFQLFPIGRCFSCFKYGGADMYGICRSEYSWYRVFTSTFSHADRLDHLAFNMAALVQFGPLVHLGLDCSNAGFIAIYTFSAFAASWTVFYLTPPRTRTWGASGAIYGVMAAKFVLDGSDPSTGLMEFGYWIIPDTMLTLALRPGVSWQGHFGGAVGGAAATYLWLIM
jgi:membrane associated rhomboid family serine protease